MSRAQHLVDRDHPGERARDRHRNYDLTTRREAQLGGVISTGAEGGNRSKPSDDIFSTHIINGNGEQKHLDRHKSQKIIGLNGATLVTQVEFEVTAFPKYEHAVFLPIKGTGKEMWKNMLKLQQRLKKYCIPKDSDPRKIEGKSKNGLIVTGMEPLSRSALNIALEKEDHPAKASFQKALAVDEMGIYITFSSFEQEGSDFMGEFLALAKQSFGKEGI